MMKKDYQLFAEVISEIEQKINQEKIIGFLIPIFKADNPRFDEEKFREFIRRRINNEPLTGLKYNPKYLNRSPK